MGCPWNNLPRHRNPDTPQWRWLFADLTSSAFLGYFTFWLLWDSGHFTASQCAVATCIVGNFGTRIFDLVRFLIFKKIGYNPYAKEIRMDIPDPAAETKKEGAE